MKKTLSPYRLVAGAVWGMLIALLAFGSVHLAAADEPDPGLGTGIVPGGNGIVPGGTGIVPGGTEPTTEPSPPAEGGEARPTEEPKPDLPPTEVPPTEVPKGDEGTPGGGLGNEGVAPGRAVIVLQTVDGGAIPAATEVCVGAVCQRLGRIEASGFKVDFDRLDAGWHEVRATSPLPYGRGRTSVEVWTGQVSTAQVVINLAPENAGQGDEMPEQEETPPAGPIREVPSGQEQPSAPVQTSQFSATVMVFDLPVTGAGSDPAAGYSLALLGGIAAILALLSLSVWRSGARR